MITVADARLTHRQELKENLDKFLNAKKKDKVPPSMTQFPGYIHVTYYRDMRAEKCKKYRLVVYSKWVGTGPHEPMMQTFIIASNAKPVPKIGIMLFEANESTGQLRTIYILPRELPVMPVIEVTDSVASEHMASMQKNMSIIRN